MRIQETISQTTLEDKEWKLLNRTIRVLHRAQRARRVTWSVLSTEGWNRFLRLAFKEGWIKCP